MIQERMWGMRAPPAILTMILMNAVFSDGLKESGAGLRFRAPQNLCLQAYQSQGQN